MNRLRVFLLLAIVWIILPVTSSRAEPAADKEDSPFIQTLAAQFSKWDKDHDQTLSLHELDTAIEDPANTGPAAAALAALKRASRATNYTLPALTMMNIRELANSPPATNRPNFQRLYGECLRRITGVKHRELFVSGLPQLSTVHQGRIGDCFCLAPLGAMIHRNPDEVASLFSTEEDGRVRISFGSGPVSVAPPTDAELAITSGNTQDGVWVNLYEKAISEVRNLERPLNKRADLAIDAIASGGSASKIMSYLTGHKVSGFSFRFATNADTSSAAREIKLAALRLGLAEATEQKRLMVCTTQKPTTPGITPKHAYALLSYDQKNDTVELWNPHGNRFNPKGPPGLTNGYPTRNGVFTIPVTEFVQQFTGMTFELASAVASK